MKKFKLALVLLLGAVIFYSGCSKKQGAEKIIGKWKVENPGNVTDTSMAVEILYEFTKDKLIAEGNMHGQPLPTMQINYTVKSEADTVLLEATHPESGAKGDFKITFEGEKLKMIDPDGVPYTLVKRD